MASAALLQQPIQRKLSALLGADVTFDKLSVSLLGGSIEAAGVTVSGGDKSLPPILTIAKLRADVAVARALKGEIVVRSLAIERPAVHFVRKGGRTNVPARPQAADSGDDAGADDKSDKTSWRFDVEKVLVVEGEVTADVDGRQFGARPVLAELQRVRNGYELTLLSDSVSYVGSVRGTGRITGAADLSSLANATLSAELHLGDFGHVKFVTPRIGSRDEGDISFHGGISLAKLIAMFNG